MTNQAFNTALKRIFTKYSQDFDVEQALVRLWIRHNTTPEQDKVLDTVKADLYEGRASCAERYYLKTKDTGND